MVLAIVPALACAVGAVSAATVLNFDQPGTGYAVVHADYGSNPAVPTVMSGGPTGNFLRLAAMPAVNLNTIAFVRTDVTVNQITADFDFRMTPPPAGRSSAADGLGFVLLNTSTWGATGGVFSSVPENAALAGSLGVGFHIYDSN